MARTVDNLGLDTSNRYAQDQLVFDEKLIQESKTIPIQTKITVTTPFASSELDQIFDISKRHAFWAVFTPPLNYFSSRRSLFSDRLIPSLGSTDKLESLMEKLEKKAQLEEKKDPIHESLIKKEGETLIAFFKKMGYLDQLVIDINGKRTQYQKG